tara:strand:- start:518 stop:769 length:252 start_codon:yes stop_codon:yes gene_type:complete
MTDSEILDAVYQMTEYPKHITVENIRSFIEHEWQKSDEEHVDSYTVMSYSIPSPTGINPNLLDAGEIEKSQGLSLDEEGTVSD